MRNLQVKLKNFEELQELNSILMSLSEKCESRLKEDLVDYFNILDFLNKLQIKVNHYSYIRVKSIRISIEMNQYRSLRKLYGLSHGLMTEDALIWHRLLLINVFEQCRIYFETKYLVEHDYNQIKVID